MPATDPAIIYELARVAAKAAVNNTIEDPFCGFAWIIIRPARGKFVAWLKANKIGDAGTYGGWELSSYDTSSYSGQSLTVKQNAVKEFCRVLRTFGVSATTYSRAD